MVALRVRSKARVSEEAVGAEEEMDYPLILNRALPQDIRVLGWTDVPGDFSARSADRLSNKDLDTLLYPRRARLHQSAPGNFDTLLLAYRQGQGPL